MGQALKLSFGILDGVEMGISEIADLVAEKPARIQSLIAEGIRRLKQDMDGYCKSLRADDRVPWPSLPRRRPTIPEDGLTNAKSLPACCPRQPCDGGAKGLGRSNLYPRRFPMPKTKAPINPLLQLGLEAGLEMAQGAAERHHRDQLRKTVQNRTSAEVRASTRREDGLLNAYLKPVKRQREAQVEKIRSMSRDDVRQAIRQGQPTLLDRLLTWIY